MTVDEILSAIRSLPVQERLRVIELVAHDVANDVSSTTEAAPGGGATLIERNGLLIAHGEPGQTLPEAVFDHRHDRDTRAELLWGRS
jgi:hypothetical protein